MLLLRLLVLLAGIGLVIRVMLSAIRTFVLPRSARDSVTRAVFLTVRWFFNVRLRWANSYADRDRVMAFYAPVSLLLLPGMWLALVLLGYMGIFWALGVQPWPTAFTLSGSSLLTLGFALAKDLPTTVLAFSEAAIGLILVALLISYLPTMYTAFSRREAAVTMLEVRAGSPPSAVEMLSRFGRLQRLSKLAELWVEWEIWFVELEETHTSLAALAFFRSPQADHSWVTAAGAILDAAALSRSVVDIPLDRQADLCLRAGYLALRRIAEYFRIKYDPDPQPGDPISIGRDEFEAAYEELASQGVPLVADREQAWRDFAGWRVNYDTVLLALATLTMAPYAPWSSDRSLRRSLS